ncbi:MAG: hypothetical protein SOZ07_06330 [Prevotella sp.]|nr:hypothetical protein [Prevotella sp.]MDY3936255.1 hypothetical protein [Prevotella sp.]MDY4217563.1 hypothetical protein [Prevotella sp.]
MKKLFFALLTAFASISLANAQVKVEEPEFADQILLLISDSEGVLLSRENATVKTKAGASLYLVGIGKVKSRLTVYGKTSPSKAKGGSTTRLIVKAKDNVTDPNSFINILKFEVHGKERRYQLAESGTLSKTEQNSLSNVEYNAKKYGNSSYYIVMNDLAPGEYGIIIGDPNSQNEKNSFKVSTFTVE